MKPIITFLFCIAVLISTALGQSDKYEKSATLHKSKVIGDVKYLQGNQLSLPFANNGVIADAGDDLEGPLHGRYGEYPAGSDIHFLFSSGFLVSGVIDGELWASGVASASRVQDYIEGPVGGDRNDPFAKIYQVKSEDGPGSEAYLDWADAVKQGADFVDLDGDRIYNPDIDKPDLLGDQMLWFAINDGVEVGIRAWPGARIVGMEIHVTAWAYAAGSSLGSTAFIRFRLINKGTRPLEDIYFTSWHDPDLGSYTDDLVGCDTLLNAGYTYNEGPDERYGQNPPCFLVDILQGPVVASPGDTARRVLGPNLGVEVIPNHKVLGMSSFTTLSHYYYGPDTADEIRCLMQGLGQQCDIVNPLYWGIGGTAQDNPLFRFSGDPVSGTGWRQTGGDDQRMHVNTGPFRMDVGDVQDIVTAFVVGRGNDELESINVAKELDRKVQGFFDSNFNRFEPPSAKFISRSGKDESGNHFIDLLLPVESHLTLRRQNSGFDYRFEGFVVKQFHSNVPADSVNEVENSKIIARFDLDNEIGNFYVDRKQGRVLIYPAVNNMDSTALANPEGASLHLRVTHDAFTGLPVQLGNPYTFGVTAFYIDHNGISQNENTPAVRNDWFTAYPGDILTSKFIPEVSFIEVVPGAGENAHFVFDREAEHSAGHSDGLVLWDVVFPEQVTGHDYEVTFDQDKQSRFFWHVTDLSTQAVVLDHQYSQSGGYNFPIVNGIMVRVFSPPADSVAATPNSIEDVFIIRTGGLTSEQTLTLQAENFEAANVFPNPYFAHNSLESSRFGEEQFVTFTHLPNHVRIRIYRLSGIRIRTLEKNNDSPFLRWDLLTKNNKFVASGIYLAHIEAPELGLQKTLKVAVVQRRM